MLDRIDSMLLECSPDGKVIILENTSRNKDITMTNWVLKRRVDAKEEITYKFPATLVLKANKMVRIWARGHGKENLPSDLVNANVDNWGHAGGLAGGAGTVAIVSDNRDAYPAEPGVPVAALDIVGRVVWAGRRVG